MGVMASAARLLSGIDSLLGGGSSILIPPAVESRAGMVSGDSTGPSALHQRQTYALLRALYWNNGLYTDRAAEWHAAGLSGPEIRELRTMQAALVEFYVATVMPGGLPDALPLVFPAPPEPQDDDVDPDAVQAGADAMLARQDNVRARIDDIHRWSNWQANKQVYIRHLAMLGNAYIYIGSREAPGNSGRADRVFMQVLEPEYVTDEDQDERGFVTYARLDVPRIERKRDGSLRPYWSTYVWDKSRDSFRYYESENTPTYAQGVLGNPLLDDSMTGDYGIDFVPLAHAMFRQVGGLYGAAPIMTALTKVDELNLKATRLAQLLFRHGKADMLLEGVGGSVDGVYSPPPRPDTNASDEVVVGGEAFWTAPPGYTIKHLIADLNYDAHRGAIADDTAHLADADLPELRYYTIGQSGNASGRALRTLLAPAVARVVEVRGNAEAALVRAHQMALTVGQEGGVDGFDKETIGTYGDDSYEHTFAERDVIPASEAEEEQTDLNRANVFAIYFDKTGNLEGAARAAGLTDEQREALLADDVVLADIDDQDDPAAPDDLPPPTPLRPAVPVPPAPEPEGGQ